MANAIGPPKDIFQSSGGSGGGGGNGTVTHVTGPLTANQLIIGDGASDIKPLGTLGTTTTILHGNASGAPTFGAVVLTTDVSGILPVANGGTGSATQNFWDLTTNQTSAGNKKLTGTFTSLVLDEGGGFFNVKAYGAVGDGSTNDQVAIDAAVAALQNSVGGGVLYFPHSTGNYVYTGSTGISNNPANGVRSPMFILGDGAGQSVIQFSGISNADCIFLSSQTTIGGLQNRGSGISGMTVVPQSGKVGIHVKNLELVDVSFVKTEGNGTTALVVEECTSGAVRDCQFRDWTVTGVNIIGEVHVGVDFENIDSTSTGSGWAFDYNRSTTNDSGGFIMFNCLSNQAGQGAFRMQAASTTNAFVFLTDCIGDGVFGADVFMLKNIAFAKLDGIYSSSASTGVNALTLDNCTQVSVTGGNFYGKGSGAADIALKNATNRSTIVGALTNGSNTCVSVDSTTMTLMDIHVSGNTGGGLICNDFTKITGRFITGNGHGLSVRNASTTAQTPAATTRTYLAGSAITVPNSKLAIGTVLTWTFNMTKTAAGTASSTIDVAIGTNGTTGDSAILSFTKPAGTAAADEAFCTVKAVVRGPLSASCIITGEFTMIHNLASTGHATIPAVVVNNVSSTFDATVANLFAGVCLTSGASDAITIQQVTADAVGF